MGHRHDLLDVYDKKRATAVFARLKACNEWMNNLSQLGEGEALTPQEQWNEQPGGLPVEVSSN